MAACSTEKETPGAVMVRLPSSSHVLLRWLVQAGAPVQQGEVVALVSSTSTTMLDGTSANETSKDSKGLESAEKPLQTGHKRPTRRRKPRPQAPSATEPHETRREPFAASSTTAAIDVHVVAKLPTKVDKKETNSGLGPPNTSEKVVAPIGGILHHGHRPGMDEVEELSVVGFVEPCTHPTFVDSLCVVCGQKQQEKGKGSSQKEANDSMLTVSGFTVNVSAAESQRMAEQDATRLRSQRKLSLVLDLDHTLVHATSDVRAREYLERPDVRSLLLLSPVAGPHQQQHHTRHYVKLRPYVKEFLEQAIDSYEIGVYTAGTRDYAEQIVILLGRHLVGATLDEEELIALRNKVVHAEGEMQRIQQKVPMAKPDDSPPCKRSKVTFGECDSSHETDAINVEKVEELRLTLDAAEELEKAALQMREKVFGRRVVSRTDVGDLGRDVKSLKRIFPCGGVMAVVCDDREDVWANAPDSRRTGEPPDNLLVVRPFHFPPFLGFADINNRAGEDLTKRFSENQNDNDECSDETETDCQLQWTSSVLKRVHERFYSSSNGDVTTVKVLRSLRQEVLTGVRVVLSGMVPLHQQITTNFNGPRPAVVRYVEVLGALLQPTVTNTTTHVVSVKDGTDKVLAARKLRGCFIVKASWLMECIWSLKRPDEMQHVLGAGPRSRRVSPMGSSQAINTSSSDEEDDEFAAEFEKELMGSSP